MYRLGWILLGIAFGLLIADLDSSEKPAKQIQPQVWAQTGLENISKETDPAKQLKAAEEYYGKAVVLFLASVVNRMKPVLENVSAPAELAEPIFKEVAISEKLGNNPKILNKESLQKSELKDLAQKSNDEDLKRLINFKKAPIADKLTSEVVKLMGAFEGSLAHEVGNLKGRVDSISMAMHFDLVADKLKGFARVEFIDPNGNNYSSSNTDGENDTLRLVPGNRDQIYVKSSKERFMLLNIKNTEQISGQYYDAGGEYLGTIRLWKK